MLPWMDKLFGTWYVPGKQWPTKYGTDTPVAPKLAGQLLQPLLPNQKASVPTAAFGSTATTADYRPLR